MVAPKDPEDLKKDLQKAFNGLSGNKSIFQESKIARLGKKLSTEADEETYVKKTQQPTKPSISRSIT